VTGVVCQKKGKDNNEKSSKEAANRPTLAKMGSKSENRWAKKKNCTGENGAGSAKKKEGGEWKRHRQ